MNALNQWVELFGDKEINQLFNELEASQQREIVVGGMIKGVKPFLEAVKQNSYRKGVSSDVAKQVGTQVISGETGIWAGIKKTKEKGNKAWLSIAQDAGTEMRYRKTRKATKTEVQLATQHGYGTVRKTRKQGWYKTVPTGKLKPTNFWSDAVNNNEDKILDNVSEEMLGSMDKYMKKVIRKNKIK